MASKPQPLKHTNYWDWVANDDGIRYYAPKVDDPGVHYGLIDFPDNHTYEPAKSKWSTGRKCPKCAGDFFAYDHDDRHNYQLIRCKSGHVFYSVDVQEGDCADALYRDIPKQYIQEFFARIDRTKVINGTT